MEFQNYQTVRASLVYLEGRNTISSISYMSVFTVRAVSHENLRTPIEFCVCIRFTEETKNAFHQEIIYT